MKQINTRSKLGPRFESFDTVGPVLQTYVWQRLDGDSMARNTVKGIFSNNRTNFFYFIKAKNERDS